MLYGHGCGDRHTATLVSLTHDLSRRHNFALASHSCLPVHRYASLPLCPQHPVGAPIALTLVSGCLLPFTLEYAFNFEPH